jgi:regulator of RNase E activity RraB
MNIFIKVIIMGILSSLFGCGKSDDRFLSSESYEKNLITQTTMSPQTITQLREYGVTEESLLKLEYFFYTDTKNKAESLSDTLKNKGYSTEFGLSAGDEKQYLITGWTSPIQMKEPIVVAWTKEMCEMGFKHDCDFDGWGTNPEQ